MEEVAMSEQKKEKKPRRARGTGSIFKLRKDDDRGVWWISYRGPDGKRVKESTGDTRIGVAQRLLLKRTGAVKHNLPIVKKAEQLTFDQAAQAALDYYATNKPRSLKGATIKIEKHLRPFFRGRRMAGVAKSDIDKYIKHRRDEGIVNRKGERVSDVSNAQINRELQLLKRIFNLAIEDGRLPVRAKFIKLLPESAPRSGFFEREQLDAVLKHLPTEIQHVVQFAYVTGWRIASEVLPLEWRQVDMQAGEVRLDAGTTKNGDGRVFPMTADLRRVLELRQAERDRVKKAGHITPLVFFREVAEGRGGEKKPQQIVTFAKAWKLACRQAGCPGRIPHDLRRTAVRNLVRAGVPERVAMKLTGHKTPSVFARYDIISGSDLTDAAARLNAASGQ
jgi:integrase